MARIVIVGAGIGGISMAFELREAAGKTHQVTLVNPVPYFQFTPSNPWVGVGWRTKADITVDLQAITAKRGIEIVVDRVEKLHPEEKRLALSNGASLGYDYLVIATGPELAFDEVAGLGPQGFTQSICTSAPIPRSR